MCECVSGVVYYSRPRVWVNNNILAASGLKEDTTLTIQYTLDTALIHSRFDFKPVGKPSFTDNAAFHISVEHSDQFNELWWNAIQLHDFPQSILVDGIERLHVVNED